MDTFFFVEIDGLTDTESLNSRIAEQLNGIFSQWISGKPLVSLIGQAVSGGETSQYAAITRDSLYFFDFRQTADIADIQIEKVKCFNKAHVIAHAFMIGSDEQEPQMRIMMTNGLKLKFGFAGSTSEANALLARMAGCEFFK